MMKNNFLLAALLLVVGIGSVNAQLLYKISGNKLEKPSYIIGTYHVANAKFIDSIAGASEVLKNVEQVYGEVLAGEMTNPANMQLIQDAMMLPDGKTLKDVLTEEQYGRLNKYLMKTMNADLSNPMVAQSFGRMTPAALCMQLTVIAAINKEGAAFDPANIIDMFLQKYAVDNNKPVGAFETLEFQLNTVYKGATLERSIETLMCLVDNPDFYDLTLTEIRDAYYKQDLKALQDLSDMKLNTSCDPSDAEKDALIYNRNADWLTKMPAIMSKLSTLFAVGAGHLTGERGVIEGLKKAGYTIEAVK